MDRKETAEKQKGEGKGPDVEHSLKLWLFVSIFSVQVLKYLIHFIALFAQLADIYIYIYMYLPSLGTLRTNVVSVLSRYVAVSNPLCVFSTEQHKKNDNW
jgi:hypothetical protein